MIFFLLLKALVQYREQSATVHEAWISRILSNGGGHQTVYGEADL